MTPFRQDILDRYIDDEPLTEAECEQLSQWVLASEENTRVFVELIAIDHHMSELEFSRDLQGLIQDADHSYGALFSVIGEAMARRQITEVSETLKRQAELEQTERLRRQFESDDPSEQARGPRVLVIPRPAVWIGLAAMLALACFGVWNLGQDQSTAPSTTQAPTATPEPIIHAWVVQEIDSRWSGRNALTEIDQGLSAGEYRLAEGRVKLRTTSGVDLVIAAPAQFELIEDNAIHLVSGKVVADVPERAHGFFIDTPTARIVDFGTKFGVSASSWDQTEVHVFEGEVRSSARIDGMLSEQTWPVYKDQALSVADGGRSIAEITCRPEQFVREVSLPLQLTDIVAGGDGLGVRADRGIDPASGAVASQSNDGAKHSAWQLNRHTEYALCPLNPLIDGVFVISDTGPSSPPLTINSAGGRYALPVDAVANIQEVDAFGPIWAAANGRVPAPENNRNDYDRPFSTVDRPDLDRRLLVMHPNVGLTLDLKAVRERHPGFEPRSLRFALFHAGRLGEVAEYPPAGIANLYVVVDEELVESVIGFSSQSGVMHIEVPIPSDDAEFLTVMTTCGIDGLHLDWVMLGEPVLAIEPIERHLQAASQP